MKLLPRITLIYFQLLKTEPIDAKLPQLIHAERDLPHNMNYFVKWSL